MKCNSNVVVRQGEGRNLQPDKLFDDYRPITFFDALLCSKGQFDFDEFRVAFSVPHYGYGLNKPNSYGLGNTFAQ